MPPIDDRERGFTLIEVLVALAVVAVSLVAIGAVVSTNLRGVGQFEQHAALVAAQQAALMTAIPDHDNLAAGTFEGATGTDRWRVQVSPLGAGWDTAAGKEGWVPERVTLRLQAASGAVVELRTVRLARKAR
jgi:general secretion pathway protein I